MRYRYTIYTGDFYNLKLKESNSGSIKDLESLIPEVMLALLVATHLAGQSIKLECWIDHDLYKIESL